MCGNKTRHCPAAVDTWRRLNVDWTLRRKNEVEASCVGSDPDFNLLYTFGNHVTCLYGFFKDRFI